MNTPSIIQAFIDWPSDASKSISEAVKNIKAPSLKRITVRKTKPSYFLKVIFIIALLSNNTFINANKIMET